MQLDAQALASFRRIIKERGLAAAVTVAGRAVLLLAIGWMQQLRLTLLNALLRSNAVVALLYKPMVRRFNRLVYLSRTRTFDDTKFLGKHILKFPTDLWTYQEILYELRPDVIIESGVFLGGSTFYLARMCELVGNGRIVAIDVTLDHVDPDTRLLPNVTLIEGSSTDDGVVAQVRAQIRAGETVMVILDSDHESEHVLREMRLYSEMVTEGQYLVVEDGIVDRVYPRFYNRGPERAIREFLRTERSFARDFGRNRYMLTVSPGGYLRKGAPVMRSEADLYRPLTLWLPGWNPPRNVPWRHLLDRRAKGK